MTVTITRQRAQEVHDMASARAGLPYSYGGAFTRDPRVSTDCSGLVLQTAAWYMGRSDWPGNRYGSTWTDTTVYLPTDATFAVLGNNKGSNGGLTGYIDEFRISRVARYTSNFTPPTAPHPDPPAIKLPTAVANTNRYTVKCTGPQTVLLSNGNGQLIDSAATLDVEQHESVDCISDGTNWRQI